MQKVNLVIIYKKVKQRIKRSSGMQQNLAIQATEAAKVITSQPSLKAVEFFRKIECKWLKESNSNSKSIAAEFEDAIRSKNFISAPVYNSNSNGFKPSHGYLYCFASKDYPGIVKIGSTTHGIRTRLLTYKSRHKLDHLEIVHHRHTSDPAFKEEVIHNQLRSFQIYPETIAKSNEWFKISRKRAVDLIDKLTN